MNKIIVALDVDSIKEAESIVKELGNKVGAFKVGKQLFTSSGPKVIEMIHKHKGKVFLDLKYHDIPNTVGEASKAASNLGVWMFNVHCSGGKEMMLQASKNKGKSLAIGVTVLTSINQDILNNELNIKGTVEDQVVHLAKLAKDSGLNGVVASPKEIKAIRKACGKDFLIITPGIRPLFSQTDDQKRTMTPKEAIQAGADYLVIGRPITKAENRVEAINKIIKEIN